MAMRPRSARPGNPSCRALAESWKSRACSKTPGHTGCSSFVRLLPPSRLTRCASRRPPCGPVRANSALLLMAALAALVVGQPDRAIGFLKRFERKYEPDKTVTLLNALALARKGYSTRAWMLLEQDRLLDPHEAVRWFVGGRIMAGWLVEQLTAIRTDHRRQQQAARVGGTRTSASKISVKPASQPTRIKSKPPAAAEAPLTVPDLPRLEVALSLTFEVSDLGAIQLVGTAPDPEWFRLRGELTQLGLLEGFDELLCLPALQGVEAHWYQIETVRKVLKQYRGRVLLADEVGLGKTIEAGMVLKEYMLRGMAEHVLILVPAPLVGQWRDEMATKFGIDFATSHDALLRSDPGAFWAQPRIIASIAVARRREHADLLVQRAYDVVVVDEAHHLREQASASYRLVNALQKRFLLLLSATPVQNSLLERNRGKFPGEAVAPAGVA